MPNDAAYVTYVIELMQPIGPVQAKRMFGGHGIFLEDLMFGLVTDNILYLKADNESENEFISQGLEAFSYQKQGKTQTLSYYQAPEESLEDSDEMYVWANKAYGAALRAAAKKSEKP